MADVRQTLINRYSALVERYYKAFHQETRNNMFERFDEIESLFARLCDGQTLHHMKVNVNGKNRISIGVGGDIVKTIEL